MGARNADFLFLTRNLPPNPATATGRHKQVGLPTIRTHTLGGNTQCEVLIESKSSELEEFNASQTF